MDGFDDFSGDEARLEKQLAMLTAVLEGRFGIRIISTLICVKCGARFVQNEPKSALIHSINCKLPREDKIRSYPMSRKHKVFSWILLDCNNLPHIIVCDHCHVADRLPELRKDYDSAIKSFIDKHKVCEGVNVVGSG